MLFYYSKIATRPRRGRVDVFVPVTDAIIQKKNVKVRSKEAVFTRPFAAKRKDAFLSRLSVGWVKNIEYLATRKKSKNNKNIYTKHYVISFLALCNVDIKILKLFLNGVKLSKKP